MYQKMHNGLHLKMDNHYQLDGI